MPAKMTFNITMKLLSLFVFLVAFANPVNAQFKVYGKIKTEKGKKYHGEVINYEPQETVTMNCQGDTMTFDLEKYNFKFTTSKPPKKYIFPDGVGYHRISLGALAGSDNDGSFLSYSYHYQKTRRIGYGGGFSFENYGDEEGYDFLVPKAMFITYLSPTNKTLFLKADAGYGIALKNASKSQVSASGGINAGLAAGYRFSTNKVMVDIFIGSRIQKANYEFDFGDFNKLESNLFRRVEFGIGFMW